MVTNALKDITGETIEHKEATNNNDTIAESWRFIDLWCSIDFFTFLINPVATF